MDDNKINRNALTFIGLATEYCGTLEQAQELEREEFIDTMLRLLPRLYITMSDVRPDTASQLEEFEPLGTYVEESHYEQIRASIATLLGEEDTYLETFEQDLKYSDTPIAASISEGLADIYQDLANFLTPVRDSEGALTEAAIAECRENFAAYWAQTLTNVMRPLNHLHFQ